MDNYKRSGVNDATAYYPKLQLQSLNHFVELIRRMQQKTKEALAIVKPDQENAYKQPANLCFIESLHKMSYVGIFIIVPSRHKVGTVHTYLMA